MKVSETWLREWVNPPVSTEQLVAQLTKAGLEVDDVLPCAGDFSGVVVGRVTHLQPHPDADRLRVCTVDAGGESLQIVCGAPNVQVGMMAPLARIGAVLPGDFKIKKSKLRGVESQGMLCSARELGLSEDAAGLMPLPVDARPGQDLREYLQLDDSIIDVDLTPNRGDCLSMAGIAREVGVRNRCEVKAPPADPVAPAVDATFPVELADPEGCPRYAGRVVRGVDPKAATPLWMRERLRRAGVRSLGPLVDITNYVMLELGQPMHAFDLDKLQGGIVVRRAQPGESLELLNGQSVVPQEDVLLIADHQGPLALAGIMGGEQTAVGDDTVNVFLESAHFNPLAIAGRARRFGLHTDSSHRFERGVDPQLPVRALERATRLLVDIAGGQPGPVTDALAPEQMPTEPAVRLRPGQLERLLGLAVPSETVEEILTRLGMAVSRQDHDWLVVPPSFRFDVRIEPDLIEEIGRIYGYDKLPSNRPVTRLEIAPRPEGDVTVARLRDALVQRGYQEAITFSFVDPVFQRALDPHSQPVALANPISADLAVMRTTLWAGLLKALGYNQKRQQPRVRLFETGLGFLGEQGSLQQRPRLAGVVAGPVWPEQWGMPARPTDFFDVKGDLETLLALTGEPQGFTFAADRHPALHPGQSARIHRNGQPVGWLGALHPRVARELDLEGEIFLFELDLAGLGRAGVPRFGELSRFPAIRRDIAVVVDDKVRQGELEACIRQEAGPLLREVRLFDVYRGEKVESGKKSLAFGLILQDFSRTLVDSDVDEVVARVVRGLEKNLDATLRV